MAVQAPNAAGFIPNRSVVQDISALIDLFGKEGKDARAADTELKRAQAANLQDIINWRPDEAQRQWFQADTPRFAAETGRMGTEAEIGQMPDTSAQNWTQIGQRGTAIENQNQTNRMELLLRGVETMLRDKQGNRELDQRDLRNKAEVKKTETETEVLRDSLDPRHNAMKALSDVANNPMTPPAVRDIMLKVISGTAIDQIPGAGVRAYGEAGQGDVQKAELQAKYGKPGEPEYEKAKMRYPTVFRNAQPTPPSANPLQFLTNPAGAMMGPRPPVESSAPSQSQPANDRITPTPFDPQTMGPGTTPFQPPSALPPDMPVGGASVMPPNPNDALNPLMLVDELVRQLQTPQRRK